MKKLTTVQVTPITQKGAVISPIQCEVKCGAAPHEVIRMVRSQVGAEHSKDTLYINSDAKRFAWFSNFCVTTSVLRSIKIRFRPL